MPNPFGTTFESLGYGKTMLLSRLREKKKSKISIIPIHLSDGRRIEGERVLEETLTHLTEAVPGAAGLTKMDLHTRRLFAHGLIPMVYSGEVPSQDKDGALASLRERPTEAFDFHNEGAAIAQWTKNQFEILSDPGYCLLAFSRIRILDPHSE